MYLKILIEMPTLFRLLIIHPGTSSFGMSGVNAHVIFQSGPVRQAPPDRAHSYTRQRFWVIPVPYKLLGRFKAGRPACSWSCNLTQLESLYIRDHKVYSCVAVYFSDSTIGDFPLSCPPVTQARSWRGVPSAAIGFSSLLHS